jgi:histone deacetylase complex regulatory component SIN3
MLDKYLQRNMGPPSSTAPSVVVSASPSRSYDRDTQYEPGLEPPILRELLKAYYDDIGRPMPAVTPNPLESAAAALSTKEKQGKVPEFESARNFVKDVKLAYQDRPEVYQGFLDLLHHYQKHLDIPIVVAGVRKLLADRPDFIERFYEYLPEAAAASNVSRDNFGSKLAVVGKQPVTYTNALEYL